MSFTGREDHSITLAEATAWTANYRKAEPNGVLSHFYGRDALMAILNQPNCMGIRIYNAIDPNGAAKLVLVGAKADEREVIEAYSTKVQPA